MDAGGWIPKRWSARLLYGGAALLALLLAFTAHSIYREWREQIGQSRADAIFQLVQGRGPMRPTDTPGASAWLNLELKRYGRLIADPAKARLYAEVADWQDTASVPPSLDPVRRILAAPLPPEGPATGRLLPPEENGGDEPLRSQRYLELDGRWLAVTRRAALDTPALDDLGNSSNRFLARASPHLLALADRLGESLRRSPLPPLPGDRPPRVVRLYALSEDGTLVSLPIEGPGEPAGSRRAAVEEGRELRKMPEMPTFVPNEFYFRFDFSDPEAQCFYSGLYLDLGGHGVVATITVPERDPATGVHWLVGADVTFDIDWEAFARHLEPPMVAEVVRVAGPAERQLPWAGIQSALGNAGAAGNAGNAGDGGDAGDAALRSAVAVLAGREPAAAPSKSQPNVLHGTVAGREGRGAVAAFQVAADTWLLTLFPKTEPRLALVPIALSAGMLVLLLAGLERNRRRAERAQLKAEGELREKQNLLNTMQVPLIVVDPNTDEAVSCNRAAEDLGILPGSRIGDIVSADPRARSHYERMQVAGREPRRAYGLPVRVRGESGEIEERYAVVRSVAVTAPIEALQADERHRLGILFLLEPEADLTLLTEELAAETRGDERRKLAGLLTHGLDTLVRVLAHGLRRTGSAGTASPELTSWLAGYIDARLRTVCWLLDHWDALPPLPPDSSVEAAQARATLDRLASVFALAAGDADLRSRLHWDNGVLSALPPGPAAGLFTVEIDWPETYWFPCPVRGGFGYFLTEVMINAVRHGRPGSVPAVRITVDRVRKELLFEVENDVRPEALGRPAELAEESYGGTRILRRLARLFDWQGPDFERTEERFRAAWRVPASERGDPRRAD